MRRTLTFVALSALVIPTLAACTTIARGPAVTEERDIDAVTAVVLASAGDLVITVGEPSLTITAPEDVMDRLTSESGDDLLVLGTTGPGSISGEIRYELSLPVVTTIKITGSGDVDVDFSVADFVNIAIDGSGDVDGTGIDAETASVSIGGSGDIELEGSVGGVMAIIDGSGTIDLGDLRATDGTVEISGSGGVTVNASRTLRVEISGSGDLRYSGGAEVTSDISGGGEVFED